MPLSKKRDAGRKRKEREENKPKGMALMSKALLRRLHAQGISIARYIISPPVSLDDYRNLERQLQAKIARVEWQSGGIKTLLDEVVTLKALLATKPAMLDLTVLQRLTQIEAGEALRGTGLPIAGWPGIEETVDHDMEDSHD